MQSNPTSYFLFSQIFEVVEVGLNGKARENLLRRITSLTGFKRPEIVVEPDPYLDAGVEDLEKEFRIYSVDPCLGVPEHHLGFLAFHFAASDVTVMGGEPFLAIPDMIFPPNYPEERILSIMRQIHEQALKYNTSIITGHTGRYTAIREPIVSCAVLGKAKKLLLPSNVGEGDLILVSGWIGGELLYALSNFKPELLRKRFGDYLVESWVNYHEKMTVVDSALALSRAGLAVAMKDGAEGGLIRAMNDLASAANLGFHIDMNELPIPEEILLLSKEFDFDPLSASSSGVLIAIVKKGMEEEALNLLRSLGLRCSVAGEMKGEKEERYIMRDGKLVSFPLIVEDPYTKLISLTNHSN